jgi:hypothetical protein
MIPKPPFASQLTREQEIAAFERLRPRLRDAWDVVSMQDDAAYTSVVVPSLTLDQSELRKIPGATFYEERMLFLLIRLRNPRARMVYVTSQPVHPMILEYYFQFLAGVPASHARARLTLLCAHDASSRSLTQKILERPRLIERIRAGIEDTSCSYLTVFNSTPLERRLAVLLDIPLNGVDPNLVQLGSKSGSRNVFRQAGIEFPSGFESLQTEKGVREGLIELKQKQPELQRAVVKLNESFSGEGNALFRYPESTDRDAIAESMRQMEFATGESYDLYFDKFSRMGGIVEEFIDAPFKTSPSAQMRITARGEVKAISTHDQILGGAGGQSFLGCSFPAHDDYRHQVLVLGRKVADVLASYGVISRFSVDFLAYRASAAEEWQVSALEINLRMGGTTHPFLALQFLTGGGCDPDTGLFHSPSGTVKYYRATDNLKSSRYRGLLPEDLIEILTLNKLHYSHHSESGVLFHLIGAVSEFGKLGVTAIANSPAEVDDLYRRTLAILDRETVYGQPEEA